MKLFKWNIADRKPKFPNIVEKLFGRRITDEVGNHENASVVPSVNIAEADKAFEVNAALPGMDKKDVKIGDRPGIPLNRSCQLSMYPLKMQIHKFWFGECRKLPVSLPLSLATLSTFPCVASSDNWLIK